MSENKIVDVFQDMLKSSQSSSTKLSPKNRWKYCVALASTGWKAVSCKRVKNTDDIVVKWEKEGEENLEVQLSPTEQAIWLNYMDKRRET